MTPISDKLETARERGERGGGCYSAFSSVTCALAGSLTQNLTPRYAPPPSRHALNPSSIPPTLPPSSVPLIAAGADGGLGNRMSWVIFITWTSTVFGLLWSVYLWLMSRHPHLPPARPHTIGTGSLDVSPGSAPRSGPGGGASDPFSSRPLDGVPGGGMRVGAVEPASPWRESVRSLVLFAAVLGFLPAWKPLSGASTLPSLLGPAVLAVVTMFAGLTVQMVRLPVLWYDRCKFLWAMEREGLYG